MSLKIYFCGSIRGGRQDAELYKKIITMLQDYGQVLTEHIALEDPRQAKHLQVVFILDVSAKDKDQAIFDTDTAWLHEADVVVAEVTQPSLGVGFELGVAWKLNKKTLCLFRPKSDYSLSAMITGAQKGSSFKVINYETSDQLKNEFDTFLKDIK